MGTKFETEIIVRPSDIDMNQHVHNSIYLDYVLYARYDQMKRCYKMPIEEFFQLGYSWVTRAAFIEYIRPLRLGDVALVQTWIEGILGSDVKVGFEILNKQTNKVASRGYITYVLISLKTGRPEAIPDFVIKKYSI